MPRERNPIIMVSQGVDGQGRNYSLFDEPTQTITPVQDVALFTNAKAVQELSGQLGQFATELAIKLLGLGATHVGVRSDKIFVVENDRLS